MGRGIRILLVSAVVVVAGFVAAVPASATFPGANGRIAFSQFAAFPGGEDPGFQFHSQVFTIKPDGSGRAQLTHVGDDQAAASPDFSPDGEKILYESNETGAFHIWVMDADGSHQKQLTNDDGFEDYQPSWSPDGKSIVFTHCAEPYDFPFIAYCDIDVMKANGSQVETLLSAGHWMNVRPGYSPDGSRIVFSSDKGGIQSAIWVMNADGSSLTRLTKPRLRAQWPDWAPDGKRILFNDHCCRPHSNLWTVRPGGGGLKKLTHVPADEDIAFPTFSPNGRRIVALHFPDGRLSTLRADGSHLRHLPIDTPDVFLSDWGPRG
jgi:TolB protein